MHELHPQQSASAAAPGSTQSPLIACQSGQTPLARAAAAWTPALPSASLPALGLAAAALIGSAAAFAPSEDLLVCSRPVRNPQGQPVARMFSLFVSHLTVWGVEPVVTHQTSWLESTGVSGVQSSCWEVYSVHTNKVPVTGRIYLLRGVNCRFTSNVLPMTKYPPYCQCCGASWVPK